MASDRRRFNGRERIALYLAADGRCTNCDEVLDRGWHSDHVKPWSKGGSTDVVNGQALCPSCNLEKGDKVEGRELRSWQQAALERFFERQDDFLAVATPGAGKTTFALEAARELMVAGFQRIIVVVPSSHLRHQWAVAAGRYGLTLDHAFENPVGRLSQDIDGTVVTYATVASMPLLWRRIASEARTLVIFDEVHHAGEADRLTWGPAMREAFEPALRRLLLSGTPFRSDGHKIPFVTYDTDGRAVASFNYDYGEALRERPEPVVRPIEFLALDGRVRWLNAGAVQPEVELSEANDDQLANALRAALNPDGDWMRSVLAQADLELTNTRELMPDAGGLVVASDQTSARKYAGMLEKISKQPVALAVSDESDASAVIDRFARSDARWIVAVKMVSEGVDIPRLAVGVYATNIRTEMFFRQVVGRFVRRIGGVDEAVTATLLIPSIEPLLRYAQAIERTVEAVGLAQVEALELETKQITTTATFDVVEPLSASEAVHHSTIRSGESFTEQELRKAYEIAQMLGLDAKLTPAEAASIGKLYAGVKTVGHIKMELPEPTPVLIADEKKALRNIVKTRVNRFQRASGVEFAQIHARLNEVCGGKPVPEATVEELQQRIQILDRWMVEL
jgi:superfamily II DNA or RNA helicase